MSISDSITPSLHELQQLAVDTIKSGEPVVGLFSVAGTGKSVIIHQVTTPTTLVAAPTGIAALNAGGVTLHKLFKLPIGLVTDKDYHLNSELKSLLRNTDKVVMDECFKGDVEVLSENGFVKFQDLEDNVKVAQVDKDTQEVSFVKPLRLINKKYDGEFTRFKSKYKFNLECTSGHELLVYRGNTGYKTKASDLVLTQSNTIKSAGYHNEGALSLSLLERLSIVYQADGSDFREYNMADRTKKMTETRYGFTPKKECGSIYFEFKKQRKIDRFLELFSDLNIRDYGYNARGHRSFIVRNVPKKYAVKDFDKLFELSKISSNKARQFLEEVKMWDGSVISDTSFLYSNTNKSSCDFVQSLCALCGYASSMKGNVDNRKESYKICYKVTVRTHIDHCTMNSVKRETYQYNGRVYCVQVPKGNIIIRVNGRTHVVGNCGMIRADQLDLINWKCRRATGIDKPFGGIQFVLVGDFFQLEPIVGYNEKRYYYEEYHTPFIFGSDIFKESNPKVIELTKVYRNENKKQVKILNSIRRKDKWYKHAIKMINDNSLPYDPNVEQLHLCCYKEDAQRINEYWYNKLQGVEWTYKAYSTGMWKDNEKIVPETVRLKLGCKVMICANDMEGEYVNGDKGVVKALYRDTVTVMLENGKTVHVTINMWEKFSYKSQGQGIDKVVEAEYNQIPIKLGWATTVHAAQGLTLDNIAIHLGKGCFSHGQLYVALSRVRNLRNISLVNKIQYSDCIVSDDVINFYKHLEEPTQNVEQV